jgi:hypothetical protein
MLYVNRPLITVLRHNAVHYLAERISTLFAPGQKLTAVTSDVHGRSETLSMVTVNGLLVENVTSTLLTLHAPAQQLLVTVAMDGETDKPTRSEAHTMVLDAEALGTLTIAPIEPERPPASTPKEDCTP